ncbi:D-arabinono-1,4-lactone oxidase [Coemansia sp. RSA 1591]|nr:D-arabinono-1,4-lactone oxidase [Coemansia sp. RSA 1591]KAJ1761738.1 D-arabinono-1,4-lactone oxidase [Coemansia sp. RSA 1752]KAJ1788393.1 D-arabinono-1,4-lactone oxidase [Coemansia sp. RSA 1938]KAJ2143685.1 D-arabinono-1,4-lactone oxidase [Coemansia sp. RSA 564]KAJ2195638.1 D-arabinono-1,4-lactone oxidase [Coemansia sp. RSA 530]KAJ2282894.1 D-arabinono-1,4-lactone oxidase [Coemansia sp. RSA 370]KAJ2290977.1 D-arabinono-1,4-lactone oxidase [Coemansia sp. RSA 355]KAJ2550405.1 D-arabinono-1,
MGVDIRDSDLQFLDSLRCQPPGYRFHNWARTFSSQPAFYLAPTTDGEIQQIVRIARRYAMTVKAIGSGHSPSDIACTDSIMLNMDKMNRVLSCDQHARTMTVEGGMRLHELHDVLKRHGLALSCVGSISDQSVAGAIATATHGTGAAYSDLSSVVVHLVLIDGTGRRQVCSAAANSDVFDAARCSLGALGIVTQVTVQCEPAFWLHAVQEPTTLGSVLDDFGHVVGSAEHVRVWWFPHTDAAVVWRANRTPARERVHPESFVRDRLYGFHVYQMQLLKARACPDDIPRLTREHFARRFDRRLEWTDDSFRVFNFDCLFPQYVNEWAVPLERAPAALRALQRWVDDEGARPGGARVHFPVEIRFVQRNSVWLSPAYDQDVCYIGVIMYRPFHWPVPYKRYWKAYEDIMRLHHGRPHWAKAHQMFYHDFVDCYPKFADFVQLRRDCDPQNIFVNDYLRRHLLPPDELLPSDSRIATDHAHL